MRYLTDVLSKLASGWTAARLDELLTHRRRESDTAAQNALSP